MRKALIVHGGAGSGKIEMKDRRKNELKKAVEYGLELIGTGSLNAVEGAVRYMEDSGMFNAGYGSCLNVLGEVELDAAIMDGSTMRGAGIANCRITHNAVSLARAVMERTEHVLIAGDFLKVIAIKAGIKTEELKPSKQILNKYEKLKKILKERNPKNYKIISKEQGTVGAVALDNEGRPAAAVSTGGLWMKLPGRIGDSAILGCGIYAENSLGAACATGTGEEIIRNALCYNVCKLLKDGPERAVRKGIEMITRVSGNNTAGVIAVDKKYRVSHAYNTEFMFVAWYDERKGKVVVP